MKLNRIAGMALAAQMCYDNFNEKISALYELKKYLYPQNITKLRCFVCRKEYFIDWRRGYPVQASVPEIKSNIGVG